MPLLYIAIADCQKLRSGTLEQDRLHTPGSCVTRRVERRAAPFLLVAEACGRPLAGV